MRTGWILCGGMQRSGSTLQYQIASELIERLGLGRRTTFYEPNRHGEALSSILTNGLSTFKTHELTLIARELYLDNRAMALYIYRDLRDVISSLQEKNKSRFAERALEQMVLRLLKSDAEWRALPRVYVSRYEDVTNDLEVEVERIASFLELDCTPGILKRIAEDLSFRSQQARIDAIPESAFVEVNPNNAYDPVSLLHRNHLQSGEVGRYRNNLDTDQIALIETLAGDWLKSNRYPA